MKRANAGFSLIELMVAVVLALLLSAALISVFVGSRSAYQETSGVAALADEGRFALDSISGLAREAGFIGCTYASTGTTGNTMLNWSGTPLAFDFRYGVGGYEAAATSPGDTVTLPAIPTDGAAVADWTPTLDAAFTAATGKQIQGSDILVLRSSLPQSTPVYTTADATAGAGSLTVSSAGSLQQTQLAVVSDCTKAVPFQIGAVTGSSPATVSFAGVGGSPGDTTTSLPVGFSTGALVYPLTTTIFYIGMGDDGDSALRELTLQNGMVGTNVFTDSEVVEDVENMQILYGISSGGGIAYVTADQVPDFSSVESLEIAVLVASPPGSVAAPATAQTFDLLGTEVTAPRDTRLRRVFEKTIGLRDALH